MPSVSASYVLPEGAICEEGEEAREGIELLELIHHIGNTTVAVAIPE